MYFSKISFMLGLKLSFYLSIGQKLTYSFSGSYNKPAGLLDRLIKVMLEIEIGGGYWVAQHEPIRTYHGFIWFRSFLIRINCLISGYSLLIHESWKNLP